MNWPKSIVTARFLRRLVFASIALNVMEDFRAEPGIGSPRLGLRLRNAFIDGYRGAVGGFLDVLEFFLSAGPTMVFLGLILYWAARWAWQRWLKPKTQSPVNA